MLIWFLRGKSPSRAFDRRRCRPQRLLVLTVMRWLSSSYANAAGGVVSSCLKTPIVILACLATRRRNSHESKVEVFRCDFPILACGDLHHGSHTGPYFGLCAVSKPRAGVLTSGPGRKDSARSTETLSWRPLLCIRTRCWRRPSLHLRILSKSFSFSSGSVETQR